MHSSSKKPGKNRLFRDKNATAPASAEGELWISVSNDSVWYHPLLGISLFRFYLRMILIQICKDTARLSLDKVPGYHIIEAIWEKLAFVPECGDFGYIFVI